MPCNSDYLEPNGLEREMSAVFSFLDELNGVREPLKYLKSGMHPKAYNRHLPKEVCDKAVALLCKKCREVDVKNYSLELQIWWRDHQEADRRRGENYVI